MNKRAGIEVSIVTPMYNEQECVNEFYRRVKATMEAMGLAYEIIMVNDGSTDQTGPMIREICANDHHVMGVLLSRNRGQCAAIYAGLQYSSGKYVVIMDADLHNVPEEIPLLINEIWKGYDFVSGARQHRTESLILRRIPSVVANFLLRATSKCPVRDMGGFGCIRGDLGRCLRLRAGQHRLLPALVYIMGGNVAEIPVSAPPRFAGHSHYGLGRSIDVLFDIIMLWFQTATKQRPLYLFGSIALFLFLAASVIFAWMLIDKFAFGVDMGSRPPFLISILFFLASLGFISTAFMLEIQTNTVDIVTGGRSFIVKEICASEDSPEDPAIPLSA